jgi:predicted kinase
MQKKILYILRGLPGSGKTTLAKSLLGQGGTMHAADDYFYEQGNGTYLFKASELKTAYTQCQGRVQADMMLEVPVIAVHNTFVKLLEMEAYLRMAEIFGYTPIVITCESNFGNSHGVPDEKVSQMLENWEDSRIPV